MADSRRWAPYLFILPAVLVMLAGLVYPVIDAFRLSFLDWEIGQPIEQARSVGWSQYRRMLEDPEAQVHMREASAMARATPLLYEVSSVHHR